jgi:hypothetical protein
LANVGIETWAVAKGLQTEADGGVLAADEEVDDGDLDERGVVGFEHLEDGIADGWREGVAAEGVGGGEANIDAGIGAEGAGEGVDDIGIGAVESGAIADAAEAFAGRLLIEERERYNFAKVADFLAEGGNLGIGGPRGGIAAGEETEEAEGDGGGGGGEPGPTGGGGLEAALEVLAHRRGGLGGGGQGGELVPKGGAGAAGGAIGEVGFGAGAGGGGGGAGEGIGNIDGEGGTGHG